MRLFSTPFEVPIIHEVEYETQEQLEAETAKEAKKRKGYGKIVSKPKEWSCTSARHPPNPFPNNPSLSHSHTLILSFTTAPHT